MRRDIVVVGASAGGIDAVRSLVARLPASFPGAIVVTVHLSTTAPSVLPTLLGKAGPLPAVAARDGMPIEHGRIHVSVPNYHLHVERDRLLLDSGPRENGFRPAIDVLFRSAALAYGARVVGVVLSGLRDDGTGGLAMIKRFGGVALVQDPAEAAFAAMPKAAIASVPVDEILPIDAIATALRGYAEHDEVERATMHGDHRARTTTDDARGGTPMHTNDAPSEGGLHTFLCPECGGVVQEREQEGVLRYQCRVGHAYSHGSMAEGQARAVEAALWAAVNALLERRDLTRRLALRAHEKGYEAMARRYDELSSDAERRAEQIRTLLLSTAPGFEAPLDEDLSGVGAAADSGR